ncbi:MULTISPECIES: hypothetical protein [Klebsiella]|uniref:hypothetical protein n=1 Tax=Klebsiella TaxID=570 RepID=UPI0019DFC43E|nr:MULTISPECIES: hypothetical protein [Klebsiella]MDS7892844.1 hypothetical protein [Klebsiella michiganensis]CAA0273442.1 Uncharacterised protein [Klebsiella oxytoca]
MKTPLQMLIDIASEMTDAAITLELIYRNTDNTCETDSGITCVVRSLLRTNDKAQEYIEQLSDASAPQQEKGERDIADDVFHATITARKLEELAHVFNEVYFTDKDNGKPAMYMASAIFDYAIKVCSELKSIEAKLN